MRNALIWIALALAVLWVVARLVFQLAQLAVNLILVAAAVVAIVWLVQRLRS
jgi:hypothetical protein